MWHPIRRVRFMFGTVIYDVQCWRFLHVHDGFWRAFLSDLRWAQRSELD